MPWLIEASSSISAPLMALATWTMPITIPTRRECATAPATAVIVRERSAAEIRLIVWCKSRQHQVEPNSAEMAARYGAELSVLEWRGRLVLSVVVGKSIGGTGRAHIKVLRWPLPISISRGVSPAAVGDRLYARTGARGRAVHAEGLGADI